MLYELNTTVNLLPEYHETERDGTINRSENQTTDDDDDDDSNNNNNNNNNNYDNGYNGQCLLRGARKDAAALKQVV